MHPIGEVTSHQAVPTSLVDIETCAARNDNPGLSAVGIEEPLEKLFPLPEVVHFIDGEDGELGLCLMDADGIGHGVLAFKDEVTVGSLVPVQVVALESCADRGLSDLPRPGDKHHLPIVLKMTTDDVRIEAWYLLHGLKCIKLRLLASIPFHMLLWFGIYHSIVAFGFGLSNLHLLTGLDELLGRAVDKTGVDAFSGFAHECYLKVKVRFPEVEDASARMSSTM